MSEPRTVGPEAFEGHRPRVRGPVVVAFLADWCPFCRAFAPEFRALAAEEKAAFLVADVSDEASPLWDRFGVEIVPTVIVFRDGTTVFRADGVPGRGLGPEALDGVRRALHRPASAP